MNELGQIAYEAYCHARDWKGFEGQSLPPWNAVKPEIQAAWNIAGQAAGENQTQLQADLKHALARCDEYCARLHSWREEHGSPVTQQWTHGLPMMQQTVLLTAIRGPDGLPKYGPTKILLRWFRRCILLSAMDGCVLTNPYETNGGSFTGPSIGIDSGTWERAMNTNVDQYLRELDAIPHHFQMHFMHAVEIVGYKHPDPRIREWWFTVYRRLVNDMHLYPEQVEEMDKRLGDKRDGLARADKATAD